ncbi:extracellular solute-binding protein [Paenibacillus cymbidii]|uniref:extracellular solute-binding protein n=1 Tax=Paenibacillus cymbidii TaxID=1639034 RepID=UPI00108073E5|nr:extracellular solute-binding protein [Paenibacillus cymbidii]
MEWIRGKKWSAAIAVTVFAIVSAGCNGKSGDMPEVPPLAVAGTKESVVLRAATAEYGSGYGYISEMARKFEAENPGIHVEVSVLPGNSNSLELMKSDSSPDIIQLGANAFYESIRQGASVDLIPYFKMESIDTDQYYKGALEAVMLDNKLAALPFDVHTMGVYYSKKRFDEQKIPYPKDGWTWNDFVETAKKLTVETDLGRKYGVHFSYDVEMVEALVIANQSRYLGSNRQSDGYLNSPKTADAIRLYADLFRTYHVAAPDSGYSIPSLMSGQIAMAFEFSYWAYQIKDPDIGLVGLPSLPQGGRGNVLYVEGLGISAKSKHKDAAWRFLRYIGMPTGEGAALWGSSQLAVTKAVAEASGQSTHPIWNGFLKELEYAKRGSFYDNDVWNGLRGSHSDDIRKLITSDGDVTAMLAKWKAEYDNRAVLPAAK